MCMCRKKLIGICKEYAANPLSVVRIFYGFRLQAREISQSHFQLLKFYIIYNSDWTSLTFLYNLSVIFLRL